MKILFAKLRGIDYVKALNKKVYNRPCILIKLKLSSPNTSLKFGTASHNLCKNNTLVIQSVAYF